MEHECYIGLLYDYEDTRMITFLKLSELAREKEELCKKHKYVYTVTRIYSMKDYCDGRKSTDLERFHYCPMCGKKIDWNELKRRCKECVKD